MEKRIKPREAARPPIPDFTPVLRKCNSHDGWTPERQRAFIAALADTGSVATACRMVNMSQTAAYGLRRRPEAASLRAAWEAALDCGVQRLKDEAFERAINGQLVPVFTGGKLMGYRRKKNDRLLMFCLRHYGQDAAGKRVTINYFAPKAAGKAGSGENARVVEASRARALPASGADSADTVAAFAGVPLDAEAQAAIAAVLEACAARARVLAPEDDPSVAYVPADTTETGFAGELEFGPDDGDDFTPLNDGEVPWQSLDEPDQQAAIDAAVAAVKAAKASGEWDRAIAEDAAKRAKGAGEVSADWRDYVEK